MTLKIPLQVGSGRLTSGSRIAKNFMSFGMVLLTPTSALSGHALVVVVEAHIRTSKGTSWW